MTKVSLLVAVKNEQEYIRDAMDSMLAQSYTSYEVIVVDDGSTDHTQSILKTYEHDKRVKIVLSGGVGKNNAFNMAFAESSGDYIAFFAGDDVMLPDSIESRMRVISQHAGDVLLLSKLKILSTDPALDGSVLPKNTLLGNRTGGSMLFPRSLFERVYPLPGFLPNEDLWLNIYCDIFDVAIVHHPVVTYRLRVHNNNSYSNFPSFDKKSRAIHDRELAYYSFLERYRSELTDEKREELHRSAGLEILRFNGDILSIFFMSKVSIKKKLRAILYASPILYWLRVKVGSFLSGWI